MKWLRQTNSMRVIAVSQRPLVSYTIDAEDKITHVNEAFWSFAPANGWTPEPGAVLGRLIWDFIDGEGLGFLYRRLHDIVRQDERPLGFTARCDSPLHKRVISTALLPEGEGSIRYASEISNEILWRFSSTPPDVTGHLLLCENCCRIESDERMVSIENALTNGAIELGLDEIELGICDECLSLGVLPA